VEERMDNYLGYEICACLGNTRSMWMIVYDAKYNYILFDFNNKRIIRNYNLGGLPSNEQPVRWKGKLQGHYLKTCEYYSNFDNACN